jgi:hypothetical protein
MGEINCLQLEGMSGCVPIPWDENQNPPQVVTETANQSGASVTTTPVSTQKHKIQISYIILIIVIIDLILEIYMLVMHK